MPKISELPDGGVAEKTTVFAGVNGGVTERVNVPIFQNQVKVSSVDDFPTPVGEIITLENYTNYKIDGSVGIGDLRIVGGINSAITGFSSEISFLHNTLNGAAMISSSRTITFYDITLYTSGSGTILDLDATGSPVTNNAIDWRFVNFSGGDVGVITGYSNVIINVMGYIDKSDDGFPALGNGLEFDASVGTIGISNGFFPSDGVGNYGLNFPATFIATRRVRLDNCSFVVLNSSIGISVDASATIPNEGLILNTVNFSGNGTYLSGIDYTSDQARFEGCRGITNTYAAANYYMQDNTTPTTSLVQSVPKKAAGSTTINPITQKFTHTDNRVTYTGSLTRLSKIIATVSVSSGNNNKIGIYIAKNGAVISESETYITANSSGRVENGTCQTLSVSSTNDYYEVWVENDSGTTDIIVEDLNITIVDI